MPYHPLVTIWEDEEAARRWSARSPLSGWQWRRLHTGEVWEDEAEESRVAEILDLAAGDPSLRMAWISRHSSKFVSFLKTDASELALQCLDTRNWVGLANLLAGELGAWDLRLAPGLAGRPLGPGRYRAAHPSDLDGFLEAAAAMLKGRAVEGEDEGTLWTWEGRLPATLHDALVERGLAGDGLRYEGPR